MARIVFLLIACALPQEDPSPVAKARERGVILPVLLCLAPGQDVDDLIRTLLRKPPFEDPELRIIDRAYGLTDAGRALKALEAKTGLAVGTRVFHFEKNQFGGLGIPFQETLGWSPSGWAMARERGFTRDKVRAEWVEMLPRERKNLGMNPWLIEAGAATLCLMPDPSDAKLLLDLLSLAPAKMRPGLIVMLGARGLNDVLPALKGMLDGADRVAALEAVAALGGETNARTPQEQLAVARGKSHKKDKEAIAALVEAREIEALSRYPKEELKRALKRERYRDAALLVALGEKSAEAPLLREAGAGTVDAIMLAAELRLDVREPMRKLHEKAVARGIEALKAYYRLERRAQYGRHCLGLIAFTLQRYGEAVDLGPVRREIPSYVKDNWGGCPLAFAILAFDPKKDTDDVKTCADALLDRRAASGGWDYSGIPSRMSMLWPFTLFPLIALDRAGRLPKDAAQKLLTLVSSAELKDGSWTYNCENPWGWGVHTGAAITALNICGRALGKKPNGAHGLEWLDANFVVGENPRGFAAFRKLPFQFLYAAGQAATACGRKELGGLDWQELGTRFILLHQLEDGGWADFTQGDTDPAFVTCLAMLFLKREFLVGDGGPAPVPSKD